MLFRSSEPSHLIPLGMTTIAVPGLPEPWSQAFSAHTMAVAGGLKQSAGSSASASKSQASDCFHCEKDVSHPPGTVLTKQLSAQQSPKVLVSL